MKLLVTALVVLSSCNAFCQDVQVVIPQSNKPIPPTAFDAGKPYPDYRTQVTGGCVQGSSKGQPPNPIQTDVRDIVGRIRDINDYYISGPGALPDKDASVRLRNKMVRADFQALFLRRNEAYTSFSCTLTTYKTCTKKGDGTKRCPDVFRAGAARKFLAGDPTFEPKEGNGLSPVKLRGPDKGRIFLRNNAEDEIKFVLQKSGKKGKAKVTLYKDAIVKPASAKRFVDTELESVRRVLKALNLPDDKTPDPRMH